MLCGDATDAACYATLMGGRRAAMGFTDPPYNVPIDGHVCGNGAITHKDFAQASGEMTSAQFSAFLTKVFSNAANSSEDRAVWFTCMDWRHVREIEAAGRSSFDAFLNLCVWAKTNGGMGSLYRSQHELVFVYRKGRAPHRNNVQLGRYGRNRTNLWRYPGVNTFREGRMEELRAHPTAKPMAMIQDAILDVSARGDIFLDPFLGAGATLIAAEEVGRVAYGMELDPGYVDTALRRWRKVTGRDSVRDCDV
ncbi:DNA-methyltransferase [Celeribacter naphthalenivorans]|uniref:DNA-methyltransferase n=1 Tax=Celeribacter naphthalenivorans TaxID=1614694 RepID=UPI001CF984B2|nr:site-specific DNA-methyltransferase [Celeribacter naphthalenivorans]